MRRDVVIALACLASAACNPFATPRRPIVREIPPAPTALAPDDSSISVTWIGHATALIRVDDRWFLTDPVFGDTIAGGLYPREVSAAVDPATLPSLDAVLISHAHFDHLDVPSLERLPPTKVLVAPPGAVKFLPEDLAAGEVAPLSTWASWSGGGVTITAGPASHGDGRYLVDKWNTHSHTGFVIEYRGRTVYFAGDTGYIARDVEAIDEQFDIDVALIPVGPAGRSKWIESLRRDVHVTPEDAMTLFDTCGAQWMVPIHFGTFFMDPDEELPFIEEAIAHADRADRVRLLEIGETTEFLY